MFLSRLRNLFQRSKTALQRRRSHSSSPQQSLKLESLEDRRMMAFTPALSYSAGTNPAGIAVGDFNHDGRDDMAVADYAAIGTVNVLLSDADGSFQLPAAYGASSNSFDAATGDLNGDGHLDLAVVGDALTILMGNGDGTFGGAQAFPASASAHAVKIGDFNNDGIADVATMNVNSASVYLGNGDGSV
ncbi:MAG: VCBS repeat-containing protein, partial [Planctomycetales bacterium]|nr:VCBS repeat-containing protein [Planctomycetales bacterium]